MSEIENGSGEMSEYEESYAECGVMVDGLPCWLEPGHDGPHENPHTHE